MSEFKNVTVVKKANVYFDGKCGGTGRDDSDGEAVHESSFREGFDFDGRKVF